MTDIKVGDTIYIYRLNSLSSATKVTKITPTGLIKTSANHTIKKNGDWLTVTGQGKWDLMSARIGSPEIEQEYKDMVLTRWLQSNYQFIKPEDIEPLYNKYTSKGDKQE